MNTLATIVTLVIAMLFNILPPEPHQVQRPPEDIVILHTTYMPIMLRPATGNVATMVQDVDNQDNVVISDNLPDEPISIESVPECGQWAEMGGHPCPQNDNATPPAYNNRSH